MGTPQELLEFDMWQEILALFREKFPKKYDLKDLPDIKLSKKSPKKISADIYSKLMGFFGKDVVSFTELLENSSHQLETTLNFDLHFIFNKVFSGSANVVDSGELILEGFPKRLADKMKEVFRYILWPWIRESYFVKRGFLKPHGFPGDFVIVENMYEGNTKSLGLGYVYDVIFLNTQLCQGLRNRKDYMKQVIVNFLGQKQSEEVVLFNVGCGGSRELREISIPNEGEGLAVYLMDFDKKAIKFSMEQLVPKIPKAELIPLNIDARELYSQPKGKNKIKPCDLIYSIGLFDYLPDRVLIKLLQSLVSFLKENGLLIFAHKDYTFYNPRIADWFCDWKYYPRTQQDFKGILEKIKVKNDQVSFSREKDGYIFFVEIKK